MKLLAILLVVAGSASAAQPIAISDTNTLIQQAYYCGAVYQRYGQTANHTRDLSEAGDHLIRITNIYSTINGVDANTQSAYLLKGDKAAAEVVDKEPYINPSVDTFCTMVYRAVDGVTSEDQL